MEEIIPYTFTETEFASAWKHIKNKRYTIKSFISSAGYVKYIIFHDNKTHTNKTGKIVTKFPEGEVYHWPRLCHNNLAPLKDVIYMDERLAVYVTNFLKKTLRDVIHEDEFINHPHSFNIKKFYIEGVLWGVDYLHSKQLCLMNISDANIFVNCESHTTVIANFECLDKIQNAKKHKECAPIMYRAPETITKTAHANSGTFDPVSANIWAVGVLVVETFFRHMSPWGLIDYDPCRVPEIIANIDKDILRVANPGSLLTQHDIEEFEKFLKLFMDLNPKRRCSALQAASSEFIQSGRQTILKIELPITGCQMEKSSADKILLKNKGKALNNYEQGTALDEAKDDPQSQNLHLKVLKEVLQHIEKSSLTSSEKQQKIHNITGQMHSNDKNLNYIDDFSTHDKVNYKDILEPLNQKKRSSKTDLLPSKTDTKSATADIRTSKIDHVFDLTSASIKHIISHSDLIKSRENVNCDPFNRSKETNELAEMYSSNFGKPLRNMHSCNSNSFSSKSYKKSKNGTPLHKSISDSHLSDLISRKLLKLKQVLPGERIFDKEICRQNVEAVMAKMGERENIACDVANSKKDGFRKTAWDKNRLMVTTQMEDNMSLDNAGLNVSNQFQNGNMLPTKAIFNNESDFLTEQPLIIYDKNALPHKINLGLNQTNLQGNTSDVSSRKKESLTTEINRSQMKDPKPPKGLLRCPNDSQEHAVIKKPQEIKIIKHPHGCPHQSQKQKLKIGAQVIKKNINERDKDYFIKIGSNQQNCEISRFLLDENNFNDQLTPKKDVSASVLSIAGSYDPSSHSEIKKKGKIRNLLCISK